jgi:hypothetical protein
LISMMSITLRTAAGCGADAALHKESGKPARLNG